MFSLDLATADRLFPFHLLLDDALRVVHAGPALLKLLPALNIGQPIGDVFETVRPSVPLAPGSLKNLTNTLLILKARQHRELVLKGQIAPLASGNGMLLLVSPRLADGDEMHRLRLTAADFALHDPISEMMFVLQAMRASLADAELLAARLRQTRDQAIQASRIKSQFLANMSHELRTPLNAIIGFTDMMLAQIFGPIPERYGDYLNDVQQSARLLLDLISDLLDLERIEAERVQLEPVRLEVTEIIEECVRTMKPLADAKNLTIAIAVERAGDPIIIADERSIRQILLNLLSNAVKFANHGGRVEITVTRTETGLQIAVADNGVGVDPATIPLLFEPFRQGDIHVRQNRDGAGLGLHIARQLAHLHGGGIDMESRIGAGTTVTVTLPASRIVESLQGS
jgi:signal transduction histidine kinase